MNNPIPSFAPASLQTGRFVFGRAARPSPLTGGTLGDHGGTSGGRQFLIRTTLHTLNAYEDLGVLLDDPDFVFEVMALKERLGLPLERDI